MKKNKFLLTSFLFYLTIFILGYITSELVDKKFNNIMSKTETQHLGSEKDNINFNNSVNNDLNLSKYWQVYDYMKKYYYDANDISVKKLEESSIAGLVKGLDDKHSEYLTVKENESFTEYLDGNFEGIGAIVEATDFGVKLDTILKGSGAEAAGLMQGDIITKVDAVDIVDLDLAEAIEKIKGKAGTKITVTILRAGENKALDIEVERKAIEIPSVESELLEDNIAYISINTFGTNTARDFSQELEKYKESDGLIIDVRNNSGGYLDTAANILSQFIEKGKTIVTTKVKGDKIESIIKSRNSGNIYKGKIVVLINENSASASEITAGALKDYDKAILVGKKTYGKGSVQVPYQFEDGSMLKLTISKWFTPKDINIDHEGIEPDIEVDFKIEDFENNYDRQKIEAIEILKQFIQTQAKNLAVDTYSNKKNENILQDEK